MSTHVEPAIKSYFFGKGYADLKNVIVESWQRNSASAKEFFSKINTTEGWFESSFSFIFWGGAGISVVVFGTIFFCAVSLLHILFLFVFFSLIYLGFTLVWTVERIFLFFRRFFSACPYCHKKSALPEYLCDNCGSVHAKLAPNSYGILSHKCKCGQKLPATFFVNRGRLQAKCPDCNQLLHREHIESRRIFIPILGGPSAGKSAFMFSVVRKWIDEKASECGFTAEFIDSGAEADYKIVVDQLNKGKVPAKTSNTIPKAFNLALRSGGKTKWLMYIYDPSGEAYQDSVNLTAHRYHEYLSGMVLIVDPFSILSVRRHYEAELSKTWSNVNPSQLNIEDVLSRIILTMEESFELSKTAKINKPLAVLISKVDAFGLEQVIGEDAVEKKCVETIDKKRSDIRSDIIKRKLIEWGEESLIHQIDTRFSNVRYYTCSALGRIPDSSGADYIPHHVTEPILWICNSVSAKDFELSVSEE